MIKKVLAYILLFLFTGNVYSQSYDLTLKISPAEGAEDDRFGNSVSISGDFLISGAHLDDDDGVESGSAYIWKFDGSNWNFFEKLTAGTEGDDNDKFGNSVSVSGNHAVIGAWVDEASGSYSGSVYIYHYNGTTWGEPIKITGEADYDTYGASVCVNGDYMIIGAIYKNNKGAAYIYHYETDNWVLQDVVSPSDGADWEEFGTSVAISGDYAIVGSPKHNSNNGAAYIYHRNGTDWNTDETKITPSGSKVGYSVGISWNKAVIGTQGSNAAFVYEYGTNWTQIKSFTGSSDQFGEAVSISGDNVIIGNWGVNSMTGSATIYTYTGGSSWSSQTLELSGIEADDRYGNSVCISGNKAIVGAHYDDPNGAQSGSATIYTLSAAPPPTITTQPQSTIICESNSALFNITATNVDSYQWYNSSGPLSNGGDISGADSDQLLIYNTTDTYEDEYYCIVSNGSGDTQSNNASLTVDNPITALAGTSETIYVDYYTLSANDPSPGTGLWSTDGNGTFTNPNLFNTEITGLDEGANTLTWTITNGVCITNDEVIITYEPTGINQQKKSLYNIFPNPGNGIFLLNNINSIKSVEVVDITGRKVLNISGNNNTSNFIDISKQKSGIYIISIKTDRNTFKIKYILK